MNDIWQQFHRLPKPIRDAVATPAALATIDRLERQHHGLDLAGFIMGAMVKEFPVAELSAKMSAEGNIDDETAQAITAELNTTVFNGVREYLGLPAEATPITPAAKPAPQPKPIVPLAPQPQPIQIAPLVATPVRPVTPVVPMATSPIVDLTPKIPAPLPSQGGNVAPTQNYSQEEDVEIAAQARKVKDIAATGAISIDDIADQVMRQHNLAFREELLQKRAASLLRARLKGIRDSEDTRAMLMRAPKVGGLGLDPDIAGNVLTTLDLEASKLKTRGVVQPPVPIPPLPPPPIPKVEPQRPTPRPPLTRDLPPTNLPMQEPVVSKVTEAPRPTAPIRRPADIPPPPPLKVAPAVAAVLTTPSTPMVRRERQSERPAMTDITRPTTSVMGPAGEMSSMTLMEFRRLGQGATDTADRIVDKFQHYQKESFALWAQALAGWRQSEVYRIYLDMGRQSLEQGMPITEVIKQRAASGLSYLSEHEFTTMADLNRRLQP